MNGQTVCAVCGKDLDGAMTVYTLVGKHRVCSLTCAKKYWSSDGRKK